jgi:hypothetical protein
MKLDIDKLTFTDVTSNIKSILYDDKPLKFWSPCMLVPFGIDNQYDKYIIKLEVNDKEEEQNHFKKIIEQIEKFVIEKKDVVNKEQFKSIIQNRPNKNSFIESKIKTMKSTILTQIEYKDNEKHYLKTVLDLPKQSKVKTLLEIYGIWDYRTEENRNEKNKMGLIVYANKITVL